MKFFDMFIQYAPSFLSALIYTIELTLLSLLFAMVIGVIVGMIKVSNNKIAKIIANFYIDIIRGTPLLVQAFLIYYGLAQLLNFKWPSAFVSGVVILSFNAGAYMAEIVRGGIEAVDKGQMEAARSLGLSYAKAMKKVILPQALRTMMPSIVNQFIISLKDTSLLSVIGIRELTMNGKIIVANTMEAMIIWTIVAIYYFVLCTFLSRVSQWLERRMTYGS